MRRRVGRASRVAAGVVVAVLVGTGASYAAAPGTREPAEGSMIERAETTLADQLDASGIPGGAVVVVDDGRVEARGVGTTGEGDEVGPDTPFVLGSTSKSFTALAVMQLVDAGAVDLDDPIGDYVPEFDLADDQAQQEITVRRLLQQTSGLSDLTAGPVVASSAQGTPLDAVAELRGAELVSTPGQEWHYANVNYVLAGLVVERASDLSYADYVQRRILEPLGMTHSYVSLAPARADGLSSGHRFWFGVPVSSGPARPDAMLAAGYLISSAEDLGRYLKMYLSGGRGPDGNPVVSAKALRTMLAPGPEAHLGPWAQARSARYAMGWFVGGPWSETGRFHPGNSPDSSSMISLFPDEGAAVATLLNASHELPVPGNPSITDRVSSNVLHGALAQDTTDLPSMWRFYLVFDALVAVLLALSLWGLFRTVAALRGKRRRPARAKRTWAGAGLRALGAVAFPVLVSLLYGWRYLWTWAPDLAVLFLALTVLWLAAAALRVLALLRPRPRDDPATSTTTGSDHRHVSA